MGWRGRPRARPCGDWNLKGWCTESRASVTTSQSAADLSVLRVSLFALACTRIVGTRGRLCDGSGTAAGTASLGRMDEIDAVTRPDAPGTRLLELVTVMARPRPE